MNKTGLTVVLLCLCCTLFAQVDKREVRRGNRKFSKEQYREAEIDYRRALVKDSLSVAAGYDLASSLYRLGDYDGASKCLDGIGARMEGTPDASRLHFNRGDAALQKKDYASAVKEFRDCLLLTPDDIDAKENYIYAKLMMQNDGQGGGGDDNREDSRDNNQDKNQDNNQNQSGDDSRQQDNPQNQDQNQDQPREQKISPQQAQQMLQAIQAREKETQDKVNKEKAARAGSRKKEKNW